jgi:hypothetical protein
MRCPECAERNSVAARKCEFCGNSFKKKPLPLGLKLAVGGVAVAVTASIAASYVVPNLVDPERTLGRAAKQLANGPKSLEHAGHIKKEFHTAVKDFLKTSGGEKSAELTASLQKLLPSSAFEVHVIELPRGLRVVEIDTLLQATGYLVMKTSSGTKVFDLPGFEVFDDARILNDTAGPVLALLGHTGGPPPHKPIVRTYALLPDYIHDETEKLVPPLKVDGTAKFAKNGHDVHIEFNLPGNRKKSSDRLAYGMLKWKDARYVSDFGGSAALIAANQAAEAAKPATVATAAAPAVVAPVVAQATVSTPAPEKIVVRSFTAADAARSNKPTSNTAVREAARTLMTSDSVLAAVPAAAPTINNLRSTVKSLEEDYGSSKRKKRERSETKQTSSSRRTAEVVCAGATLRARPGRGSASLNNFGRGTTVTVLSKDGDWYHVRANGQEGYIFSSLLKEGGSPQVAAASSAPAPASGRRRRSRRSADEHMLIADATPRKRASQRDKSAPAEPILVP